MASQVFCRTQTINLEFLERDLFVYEVSLAGRKAVLTSQRLGITSSLIHENYSFACIQEFKLGPFQKLVVCVVRREEVSPAKGACRGYFMIFHRGQKAASVQTQEGKLQEGYFKRGSHKTQQGEAQSRSIKQA